MKETIDTLMAIAGTLEAVAGDDYELNQFNYEISEAWDKLTEGNTALIEYLENEYHQGHYKGPLIKRLEVALMEAEDVINAAFKDAEGDVYHDWKAVAGLCQEWISTINGYYRYNPEPGTLAHAVLQRMKETPSMQLQSKPQKSSWLSKPKQKCSDAAMRLEGLTGIYQKLIDEGFIVDGHWKGTQACFWTLVYELNINHEIDNGGFAWMDVARWVNVPGDVVKYVDAAQKGWKKNTNKIARGPRAALLRAICKK